MKTTRPLPVACRSTSIFTRFLKEISALSLVPLLISLINHPRLTFSFNSNFYSEANAVAPMGSVEDEVRAPLPSKVERLYGDYQQASGGPRATRAHNAIPHNALDAFRDFR
jgi:hypothetical protein